MGGLDYLAPYIQRSELLKKAACLFAGMNHMQPLLLATTNSHYLLDRFCMERCCSGEYVSRIVTSLIFMEILSIVVVRIVLYVGIGKFKTPSDWNSAENLVSWTRHKEEPYRDYISTAILWAIFLGHIQVYYAFATGGKKGHMHWFYTSLLIQHFLNSLIAGSIGFWEVGLALWYLVTLPMAPIVVFFYQMIIHSWIRNNGPRDVEYIVVEWQIILALFLSCIAAIFWTVGYVLPHIPHKETTLKLANPGNPGTGITATPEEPLAALKIYSVNAGGIGSGALTATISADSNVKVRVHSITVTLDDGGPVIVYPGGYLTNAKSGWSATVTASVASKSVKVEIEKTGYSEKVPVTNVSGANVKINKIHLALDNNDNITVKEVTVQGEAQAASETATVTVKGYTCYPENLFYISEISGGASNLWNSKWDAGKCFYAECCYNGNSATDPTLLKLHIIGGGSPGIKYYGKDSGSTWRVIDNETKFRECVKELVRTGYLATLANGTTASNPNSGDNTNFGNVLGENWSWWPSSWKPNKLTPTWFPLVMQGLSVGAVGSIFPNLIPKTLTCPKTTRNLSVINMFMVTLPHIFNVMLGDMDLLGWIGVGAPWEGGFHTVWSLYIFYGLAILFAIFNIHYPEWALSSFLRNNTWMVFLMILFTDVLNETFNAISRAGICSQKAAGQPAKKNHPCLHNKIACLMNLMYIIPWMTTTPMMKSYVTSLDPFLCDKDRDSLQ